MPLKMTKKQSVSLICTELSILDAIVNVNYLHEFYHTDYISLVNALCHFLIIIIVLKQTDEQGHELLVCSVLSS